MIVYLEETEGGNERVPSRSARACLRGLRNACERIAILSTGLDKMWIEMAPRLKKEDIPQAAAYLRVPRHILVYRIGKYGLRLDA